MRAAALQGAGFIVAAGLVAGAAHAQVSPTATARQLALQGIELVEAGNCERGEPLLEGAEKLHHATVHLQYIARCRAHAGRLVTATELWRRIVVEGAPPGSSPAVQGAVAEATSELDRNLPKLGSAVIRTASRYDALELSLDGTALPTVVLGARQVLDPGHHELVARAPGYATWRKEWTLSDGQSIEIDVELAADPGSVPPGGTASDRVRADQSEPGSQLQTYGWIGVTAGGAMLAAGTVTWILRNRQRDRLERDCLPDGCPRSEYSEGKLEDEKQSIRNLTTATNILVFGGGAVVLSGVALVLLGGASNDRGRASVSPVAVPGGGAFLFHGRW